jgi:hypothetical protein
MTTLELPLNEHQATVVSIWKEKMFKKLKRAMGGKKAAKDPTEGEVLVALANEMVYGAVVSRKLETQIIVAKRKAKNAPLTDLLHTLKVTGRKRGPYNKAKKASNKTT